MSDSVPTTDAMDCKTDSREERANKRNKDAWQLPLCTNVKCRSDNPCGQCWAGASRPMEFAVTFVDVPQSKLKANPKCRECKQPASDAFGLVTIYAGSNYRVCMPCCESKHYVACDACAKFNEPRTKVCANCGSMDFIYTKKPKKDAKTAEAAAGTACLTCRVDRSTAGGRGHDLSNKRWMCRKCHDENEAKRNRDKHEAQIRVFGDAIAPTEVRAYETWTMASPRQTFAAFSAVYSRCPLPKAALSKAIAEAVVDIKP